MKLVQLGLKAWEEFGKDNASQMSAAIAYYVLFAVVPLTIFLVSVVNVVVPNESRDNATEWIEDFLNVNPQDVSIALADDAASSIELQYGADALGDVEREITAISDSDERAQERISLANMVEAQEPVAVAGYRLEADDLVVRSDSFISETMQSAAAAAVPLGVIGFVLMAFSASIAFSAIRRSLNFVWHAPHRPFAQQRIMELSMLIGLIVLLGGSVAATTITQVIRELNEGAQNPITSNSGVLWLAIGYVLPWVLTFALLLCAYRFVPNAPTSFGDVWLGAALASLAIETLKYGYGVYVVNFSNYGAAYGALGGVLLFMFFVWLSSYIFLIGAEVASEYANVMRADYSDDEPAEAEGLGLRETIAQAIRGLFFAE